LRHEDELEPGQPNLNLRCIPRICGGMPKTSPSTRGNEESDLTEPRTGGSKSGPLNYGRKRAAQSKFSVPAKRQATPENRPQMTRIIYDLGKIDGDDKESVQQQIDELHHHTAIQSKCEDLEKSGAKYLQFIASEHGTVLKAKRVIPPDTELCYYIGRLNSAGLNPPGNHSMAMGISGRTRLIINATRVPRDGPPGCSMHMGNHDCNPNCEVITYFPEGWNNDLALLILKSNQKISEGALVTFDYLGSMWLKHKSLPSEIPADFRKILCGCANPCPNGLGRLDWIEPRIRLSVSEREKWSRGRIPTTGGPGIAM
jgi:hypothetical protein